MSLAQIKDEIAKLSPAEVVELKRYLFGSSIDDPEYLAEVTRRLDEMEAGRHVVTRDELLKRAREIGVVS